MSLRELRPRLGRFPRDGLLRGVLVAGTRSGSGKTSVALGCMAALARRGLDVRAFKAGPDFIDPGHHARACALGRSVCLDERFSRSSHNLDTWMLAPDECRAVFARYAIKGDLAVVEGVMGLFDGAGLPGSAVGGPGSSAGLAAVLGLPVLLVLDCAGQAASVAAAAFGFTRLDPGLRFAGLILNNVASPRHEVLLRAALAETLPGLPVLGCLPRDSGVALASRHLGLVTAGAGDASNFDLEILYARLADWVEAHLDLDALLRALPLLNLATPGPEPVAAGTRLRLGVARDAAFCFCYAENLRRLKAAGLDSVFFSPLADAGLPPNLDGLYLPGGYPELYAERLAANASLRRETAAFCASGRPVWAECGGFMYLCSGLRDGAGARHTMCGVFRAEAVMGERLARLGYRQAVAREDTCLLAAGETARGHEFHYSRLAAAPTGAISAVAQSDARGTALEDAGLWAEGKVLGGYLHLHLGSAPQAAGRLAAACRAVRDGMAGES